MSVDTDLLSDEQLEALSAYARQLGKNWKEHLLTDWMNAGEKTRFKGEWAYLQQIRNKLGPSWLSRISDMELDSAAAARLGEGYCNRAFQKL